MIASVMHGLVIILKFRKLFYFYYEISILNIIHKQTNKNYNRKLTLWNTTVDPFDYYLYNPYKQWRKKKILLNLIKHT